MSRRRCVVAGCPTLIRTGSRCPRHRTEQRMKYHGAWPATSKAAITAHVAEHGWHCPGYGTRHQPHPSTDLVLDHPTMKVMCRQINTAKRNTGDR